MAVKQKADSMGKHVWQSLLRYKAFPVGLEETA